MTKLATMGTSSCATLAIQGFKDPHIKMNEDYIANPDGFKEPDKNVKWFCDNIIMPTSQPLGSTDDYPFDALMETLAKHRFFNKKFTIITINDYQELGHDGYWPKRFKHWGFNKIHITANNIMDDALNHIYVRDLAAVDMEDDDEG